MPSRAFFVAMLLLTTACASNPRPQTAPQSPTEFLDGYARQETTPGEERPPEPVTIGVFPTNSLAGISGATVRISYRIPRHPDNRRFRISWGDEGGEWGATEKSLDGADSPIAFDPFYINYLEPGSYTVTLTLIRMGEGGERTHRAVARFTVN